MRRKPNSGGHRSKTSRGVLEALWNEHRAWVAAVVEVARPRAVDLEDLLQEVALRFLREFGSLRDRKLLRPWLRQIARNVCRDSARRSSLRRTEAADLETLETAACKHGTNGAVESRDEIARIHEAMATLPAAMRELLALRAVDGLSQRQLAATLGVPETTIEQRLVRARRALRTALAPAARRETSPPRSCLR